MWLVLWLDNLGWTLVIFPLILIPLFFPSGAPASPRWGLVGRFAVALWLTFLILASFIDRIGPASEAWSAANPIGFIPASALEEPFVFVWGLGLLAVSLGSVTSLFFRYRRAEIGERQQIRWLLMAGAVFFASYLVVGFMLGDADLWWADLILVLSILGMPVAIGIAVFRYRLWDLEVVVNRAVIYGLLTTLLAGLFAAVIAIVTEVGKELLGEGSRAAGAAISALVVAVVFQPLRTWIEEWVNRRFYPEKLDLASGLVEVQPEFWGFLDRPTLIRVSMEHVCRALGTPGAAFFESAKPGEFRLAGQIAGSAGKARVVRPTPKDLAELGRKRVVAAAGSGLLAGHVPIYVDRGKAAELLGVLSFGPRASGKGYSGDDLQGLVELGGKIGLALKAIQLGEAGRSG